jgi:hypothetical protein|tara:strand:+ start:43 stop:480 length:438 start_codon:yes stop_codon:yes gene_type:complete
MIQTSFFPQPEKENNINKCRNCHEILPVTAFPKLRPSAKGIYKLDTRCRKCLALLQKEQKVATKNATPIPKHCDCCGRESKLQVDHLHGTNNFRGWLCRSCNGGMGGMGDNLEGVLQAAIYLEKDINKIIETLNKVFNEMFARKK